MPKRVTFDLPDDVAAYLESVDNSSAAVADAVRARMGVGGATRQATESAAGTGNPGRSRRALPPMTTQQKAEIARRYEMVLAGTWPTDGRAA